MRGIKRLGVIFLALSALLPLSSCFSTFPYRELCGIWVNDFMVLNGYDASVTHRYPDGTIILEGITYDFYCYCREGSFYIGHKGTAENTDAYQIWRGTIKIKNDDIILKVTYDYISDYKGKTVTLYQVSDKAPIS